MSIEFYPSVAKIKRNGVYENLPGFVPETHDVAVEQMIASGENTATAQYVHAIGNYFILNDTLYRAIANINVGDAIVVGTNCVVAVLANDVTSNRTDIDGLIDDVDDITDAVAVLEPAATPADVGKALIVKTVSGGKATSYEFGEAGGGGGGGSTPDFVNKIENVNVATFDDGTSNHAKKITVAYRYLQNGSGEPAGNNKRPITPINSCKITVSSKNMFDPNTNEHWVIDATNSKIESANARSVIVPAVSGEKYAFSIATRQSGAVFYMAFIDVNDNVLSRSGTSSALSLTATAPNNTAFMYAGVTDINNVTSPQLEKASNASTYENYYGTSIPYAFPVSIGVSYGGTLTINEDGSGEINETWNGVTFDGINNLVSVATATYIGETTTRGYKGAFAPNAKTPQTTAICNEAVWGTVGTDTGKQIFYVNASTGETSIRLLNSLTGVTQADTPQEAAQKLNAYLAENPLTIVYELTTPIITTLSAQQVINILEGLNNVWSDTGNIVMLQYYGDSKDYIDTQDSLVKALIAKELTSMIADTALVANDFRIVDNTLYKITAPISSGGTLTPGTNCVATTVTDVIKTLLT